MKRVIYGVVGLALIVFLGFYTVYTYRDQVEIFPAEEAPMQIVGSQIEEKEYLTLLEGIEDNITDVQWVDEDSVRLITRTDVQYIYKLSLKELRKESYALPEIYPIALEGGGTLGFNQEGILVYEINDTAKVVDPQLIVGEEARWVLAPDQRKLLFADRESGKIKVYSFSKGKTSTSLEPIYPLAQTNLRGNIGFSPDSGYFYLINTLDASKEATFSVYGADSVKLYAKEMMGFKPVWAPDKILKLAYHYTDSLQQLENMKNKDLEFIPERVGIFDIRSKRATYLTLPEDGRLFGPMIWRGDELMATLCNSELQAVGLYRYNTKDKKAKLKAFEEPIALTMLENIFLLEEPNKQCITYDTQDHDFAVVLQGVEEKNMAEVNLIEFNGKMTGVGFSPYGLIYSTEDRLYIQKIDAVKVILSIENEMLSIYQSPLGSGLIVIVKRGESDKLLWINLEKL